MISRRLTVADLYHPQSEGDLYARVNRLEAVVLGFTTGPYGLRLPVRKLPKRVTAAKQQRSTKRSRSSNAA